ncbi:hypothetical protein PY257_13965 [Ramlibacter sp. H39-3-26]|nr:hypothetical protein [Ramlibacter sp. H39-3-26]MDF1486269.1 hypothetical protein [Ramlibacter sp. H39-3-26]
MADPQHVERLGAFVCACLHSTCACPCGAWLGRQAEMPLFALEHAGAR